MRYTISHRSALLLAIVCVALVQGHHRISHDKCEEYRSWASSNKINCDRPASLILTDHLRVGDFPHFAFFGWQQTDGSNAYQFLSSGSLISDRYLLTAAHSTRYEQRPPDVARLGVVDLSSDDQLDTDYAVEKVVVHPNFTARYAYNDIALVRLREPVDFSKDIRPACLWDSLQMNFTSLVITGLGSTDYGLKFSHLQEYKLDIVSKPQCEEAYGGIRRLRNGVMDHQLCMASSDRDRLDNCQGGDSGSPAQIKLDPKDCVAYVVGIGSHGARCGGGNIPDIFTRVASFVNWIEGIVWNHSHK